MLVLTRRTDEKIVLPTLGTTIQVVAARPGIARIGVEAPDTVPVFREEVLDRLDPLERARLVAPTPPVSERLREQVRLLSDVLNAATLELIALRRQLAQSPKEELAAALDRLIRDLRAVQKAAGTESVSPAITSLPVRHPEFVVY